MLLVNWLYYEKELLSIDDIVFLSGKTGEGKSALIDAMQVVILGRCDNAIFNKSANDKSSRDLLGYLTGKYKNGTCKREKGAFSSHLCMEFENENKEVFSFGIVFDISGKSRFDMQYHYYMMNQPIPNHCFIEEGQIYNIRKMKRYLDQFQHRNCRMFTTNTDYRNYFCQRMMIKDVRFFDVFKMAVAYTPMMNISQFIVKNICQEEEDLDLEVMQEEMHDYRQMKEQLETVKEKKEQLELIHQQYIEICNDQERKEKLKEEKKVVDYYEILLDKRLKEQQYEELLKDCMTIGECIEQYAKKREQVEKEYEQIKQALNENTSYQLQQKKEQLTLQIQQLHQEITQVKQQIKDKNASLEEQLRQLESIDEEIEGLFDLSHQRLQVSKMQNQLQEFLQFNLEEYKNLQQKLQELDDHIRNSVGKYSVEIEILKQQREELKTKRQELEAGKKVYPAKLMKLKEELTTRLSNQYHQDIQVEILADVLQIKDVEWTNAIEGYIHNQKFNLVVEEAYFMDAYHIYQEIKESYKIHTYSIIDVGKAKPRKPVNQKTLLDCVEVKREDVKNYISFLLGHVVCCENEQTLRAYPVSITKDCMLYSGYAVSAMNPRFYEQHYIGEDSIAQQLQALLKHQEQVEQQYQKVHKAYYALQGIHLSVLLNDDFIYRVSDTIEKAKKQVELEEELNQLQAQENPETLTKKIQLQEQLEQLKKAKEKYLQKEINDRAQLKKFEEEQDNINKQLQELTQKEREHPDKNTIELPTHLQKITEMEKLCSYKKRLDHDFDTLEYELKLQQEQLINKKLQYNTTFHIHLNTGFYCKDYEKEYEKHSKNKVEEYTSKCDLAKQKAYECFQNNFFSAINSKIENVKMQIDRLNRAIKRHQFGRSRYEFVCSCNEDYKEYYHLITNKELDGRNLLNTKVYEENEELIKDLFNKISSLSSTMDHKKYEILEKEVKMFSRFTTYLKFDILENGNSLRATIGSSSGGETQTPFYVAVLVSLFSVYDQVNDGLQLAIFDEAFDKMDNERIEECILLLKNLGFQAIIVTPTDKIANLSKLADETIIATSDEINGQRTSTLQQWRQGL
ncbi:hypothetical protein DW208_04585 [Erysipelotrichaceae bacterium AM17-60]|nr:hypothetical protein DW208_04585 [Erysipelotrichaceae bacterium AM17-60]